MSQTHASFGAFLKARREAAGWTQPEAAAAAGIEQSYLSKLETNKSLPSAAVFARLAEAFGFDADAVAAGLDEAALAALGEVAPVRRAVAGRRARQVNAARGWMLAGLVCLVLGGAAGALALLAEDRSHEVYLYQSPGVIAAGEDLGVYDVLTVDLPADPGADRPEEAALRARQIEMLARADAASRTLRDAYTDGFIETVEGGRRYFKAVDSQRIVERSPLRWFAIPALMLLMGALGCAFISTRWR